MPPPLEPLPPALPEPLLPLLPFDMISPLGLIVFRREPADIVGGRCRPPFTWRSVPNFLSVKRSMLHAGSARNVRIAPVTPIHSGVARGLTLYSVELGAEVGERLRASALAVITQAPPLRPLRRMPFAACLARKDRASGRTPQWAATPPGPRGRAGTRGSALAVRLVDSQRNACRVPTLLRSPGDATVRSVGIRAVSKFWASCSSARLVGALNPLNGTSHAASPLRLRWHRSSQKRATQPLPP